MKQTRDAIGVISLALLVSCFIPTPVVAQSYPHKPIRFIVALAPGGAVDIITRIVVEKLTATWHQSIVVDNRPGASGIVGTEMAAKAAPDGYTILMGTFSILAANASLYSKLPYDTARDFAPITFVASSPNVLVVHPSIPAHDVKELITLARFRLGQLSYASPGSGTSPHLAGELFKGLADVDLLHVPYKGAGQGLIDVLGGHVPVMFTALPGALPHIRTGKLRALAVTTAKRFAAAPDVPALAETFPGFEAESWQGVVAPARTPVGIIAKLNAEIVRILQLSDVHRRMLDYGFTPGGSTPQEFAAFIKSETEKWGRVIREAGITAK